MVPRECHELFTFRQRAAPTVPLVTLIQQYETEAWVRLGAQYHSYLTSLPIANRPIHDAVLADLLFFGRCPTSDSPFLDLGLFQLVKIPDTVAHFKPLTLKVGKELLNLLRIGPDLHQSSWFRHLAAQAMTEPSGLRFQEYISFSILMHEGIIKLPVRNTRGVPIAGAGAMLEFSVNRHVLSYDFSDCLPSSLDHALHTMFGFKKLNFPAVDRFIVSPNMFIGWQDTVSAATPWAAHPPSSYFNALGAHPLALSGLLPYPHPPGPPIGHISRSLCNRAYGHLCAGGQMVAPNFIYYKSTHPVAPALPQLPAYFVLCVRKHAPAARALAAMGPPPRIRASSQSLDPYRVSGGFSRSWIVDSRTCSDGSLDRI